MYLRLERLERRVLCAADPRTPILAAAQAAGAPAGAADLTIEPLLPTPINGATADKPQSKLWKHGGTWWGVFPDRSGTYVWRLDDTSWTPVLKLSDANSYRADVKAVGDVTHILLFQPAGSKLASVEYVPANLGSYRLWAERPALVDLALAAGVETATIDSDCTGRLWLASDGGSEIEVRYSDAPYSQWDGPIRLANSVTDDDIAAVTALADCSVGVMWSNQNTRRFGFRVHAAGNPPTSWSDDEVPAGASAVADGSGMADDHIHLAFAANGTLYAAVKTGYESSGLPLIGLLVRHADGSWDPLHRVDTRGTRPIVLVDDAAGQVLVVYTAANQGGAIVVRESAASPIAFGDRVSLLNGVGLNNVSGTKQPLAGEAVLIAGGSGTLRGARLRIAPPASNRAPIVSAGPDRTVDLESEAVLDGTVQDDGRPAPPGAVQSLWSVLDGPGTVRFGDATSASTTAQFSAPGVYRLRLSADDSSLTASDDVVVTVLAATSTTVSFQDGVAPTANYSGTRDASILSQVPTVNLGASNRLNVDGAPDMATLIRWDTTAIPAGSRVQAATITVHVTGRTADTYELYALKRDWSELQVTWKRPASGGSWQLAGAQGAADRDTTVLGTVTSPTTGVVTITLNEQGLAALQRWVDEPASNFGIILQDYPAAHDRIHFNSRDTRTQANRPKLTVQYVAGPVSPGGGAGSRQVESQPAAESDSRLAFGTRQVRSDRSSGPPPALRVGVAAATRGLPAVYPPLIGRGQHRADDAVEVVAVPPGQVRIEIDDVAGPDQYGLFWVSAGFDQVDMDE
jgi:hypothetical protein